MVPRQPTVPPTVPPGTPPRDARARGGSAVLRATTGWARDTLDALGASGRTIRASLPVSLTVSLRGSLTGPPDVSPRASSTSLADTPIALPDSAVPPRAAPDGSTFDGRRFRNAEIEAQVSARVALTLLKGLAARGRTGRPTHPVPVEHPDFPAVTGDLAATWLGHAAVLLEVDGARILADPMFGDRASPSAVIGPRRLHPVPVAVTDLPPIDAIVISHDHYDHLDRPTVAALLASSPAPFLVPLGIGAHLRGWGVPADRIVELDWHQRHALGDIAITCTPARHFSGRGFARDTTLWSSWVIAGPAHRVFFGGDTGYTVSFTDIGRRYGPFDLTALPVGAYDAAWPDVHMTPEQARQAHHDLAGAVLLPIHWATFNLALHAWAEPIERLLRTAFGTTVVAPPPGRRIVVGDRPPVDAWWRPAAD